jgi:hypothetical protein
MPLADVTASGVRAAIAEFDRMGRDAFLHTTGFGRAREYFLEYDGRLYDSKAIVGYAHGVSTGTPLGPADFSGGDQTVARRLQALGFTVQKLNADGTGGGDLPDLYAAGASAEEQHTQRREQVRRRVEDVLDKALQEVGPDYVLPDGRLVAIYYSKIRDNGGTWFGVPNRIRDDDILVVLLGDATYPTHLVFSRAEALLRYKADFQPVGGDRLSPPIRMINGSFMLWRPPRGLRVPLDDRIDAYYELLYPTDSAEAATVPIGRTFVADDENVVPRAAASGVADPDLVGRGNRAHRHTRNGLAAHLSSLEIRPLDPTRSDPPFDLAWWKDGTMYVAEVKSTTRENEEHQLRLGLGQLLRYCHLLRRRAEHIVPVLVPERKPRDPEWGQLCKALNVRLAFPPDFEGLSGETGL